MTTTEQKERTMLETMYAWQVRGDDTMIIDGIEREVISTRSLSNLSMEVKFFGFDDEVCRVNLAKDEEVQVRV